MLITPGIKTASPVGDFYRFFFHSEPLDDGYEEGSSNSINS